VSQTSPFKKAMEEDTAAEEEDWFFFSDLTFFG